MKKDKIGFAELINLAKRYSLEDNELFISCANQYDLQTKVIEKMRAAIDKDDLLCTKEYVKGRENVMANPLVKELPKHMDSANKTLTMMLNIITSMGGVEEKQSKLKELADE